MEEDPSAHTCVVRLGNRLRDSDGHCDCRRHVLTNST